MVELVLNSNISTSMGFAPFKINYRFVPYLNLPVDFDTKYKGVKQFAQQVMWTRMAVHDAIIQSRVVLTHHTNAHRHPGTLYNAGEPVYLSTKNLNLPKGRVHKLLPRFIGPLKVLEARNNESVIVLQLPEELASCRIHPKVHTNLIHLYIANNDKCFPKCNTKVMCDFGMDENQEWFVYEIIAHQWTDNGLELQVQWMLGGFTRVN